ncbi:MAG TPA: TlyA family RNA methyltransferase [Eubacteriaceae bacterium]|jgi:23S rRNA (cytidine1920-2'-O)/16S rRNA (cytidine1409-2'-O)-methyltransferase|nr:TlyA family RNA methyltransferase [Eubacteriaceae bacterium]
MKKRLDIILYEKGWTESREKARSIIMAGLVYVEGKLKDKPGEKIDENLNIEIKGNNLPYVSRGGLKLEKAIKEFNVAIKDKIFLDIGASTGGFTDCLLQYGAKKVYSIDVGYGQLAWKLRKDSRVISMERTNFRYLTPDDINDVADGATIDVSFISLAIIFNNLYNLLKEKGEVIALIKPQFEAGREKVGKKGVIREPKVHIEVIKKVIEEVEREKFFLKDLSYSPIKGPAGNIEFLAYFTKYWQEELGDKEGKIHRIVARAHEELNN